MFGQASARMPRLPHSAPPLTCGETLMPNTNVVTLSIPHQLTREEAKKRVDQLVAQVQRQYAGGIGRLDQNWSENTMDFSVSAMGMTARGKVQVEMQVIRMEVVLPAPLAMLAGTMKQTLEREGTRLLGKS